MRKMLRHEIKNREDGKKKKKKKVTAREIYIVKKSWKIEEPEEETKGKDVKVARKPSLEDHVWKIKEKEKEKGRNKIAGTSWKKNKGKKEDRGRRRRRRTPVYIYQITFP